MQPNELYSALASLSPHGHMVVGSCLIYSPRARPPGLCVKVRLSVASSRVQFPEVSFLVQSAVAAQLDICLHFPPTSFVQCPLFHIVCGGKAAWQRAWLITG